MQKKAPNRSTGASVFIRMPQEDRDLIEKAIAKQLEDLPAAKMGVGAFMLSAAVEKARKILSGK